MEEQIIQLDSVDSTNEWVKRNIQKLHPAKITLVVAKKQTKGRGTRGKSWSSPKSINLYASYYLQQSAQTPLANLAQITALSVAKTLDQLEIATTIKWPNDIFASEKKIAGILCETIPLADFIGVIIGIGLNIQMTATEAALIDQPATSLWLETKKNYTVEDLLPILHKNFVKYLHTYLQEGFSPFRQELEQKLLYKGKRVQAQCGGKMIAGVLHSITEEGHVRLLLKDGSFKILTSAEIRPIVQL